MSGEYLTASDVMARTLAYNVLGPTLATPSYLKALDDEVNLILAVIGNADWLKVCADKTPAEEYVADEKP